MASKPSLSDQWHTSLKGTFSANALISSKFEFVVHPFSMNAMQKAKVVITHNSIQKVEAREVEVAMKQGRLKDTQVQNIYG